MTQSQFAELCETHPHTVSRWESGTYFPNEKCVEMLLAWQYHTGFYEGIRQDKPTPCGHKNTTRVVRGEGVYCGRCEKNLSKKPSQRIREIAQNKEHPISYSTDMIDGILEFLDEELG